MKLRFWTILNVCTNTRKAWPCDKEYYGCFIGNLMCYFHIFIIFSDRILVLDVKMCNSRPMIFVWEVFIQYIPLTKCCCLGISVSPDPVEENRAVGRVSIKLESIQVAIQRRTQWRLAVLLETGFCFFSSIKDDISAFKTELRLAGTNVYRIWQIFQKIVCMRNCSI